MRISELYRLGRPVFSFEFFPPKTEAGFAALFDTIADLAPLGPDFVSVTCPLDARRKLPSSWWRGSSASSGSPRWRTSSACSTRATSCSRARPAPRAGGSGTRCAGGRSAARRRRAPRRATASTPTSSPRLRGAGCRLLARRRRDPETHPTRAPRRRDLAPCSRRRSPPESTSRSRSSSSTMPTTSPSSSARARAGIAVPIVPGIMPVISWPRSAAWPLSGARASRMTARERARARGGDDERARRGRRRVGDPRSAPSCSRAARRVSTSAR